MFKRYRLYIILTLFCLSFYVIQINVVADTFDPPPDGGPPNMLSVVQQVATEHPDWLENIYNSNDNPSGTWDFLDEVIRRLRAQSIKWGYNGKRGDLKNPSGDVISYYYGPGEIPTSGTMQMYEVYLVDIATFGQPVHWNEVTDYTGCILGAYLYPRTGGNFSLPLDKPAPVENCDSDEGGAPFPAQLVYAPPTPTNLGQLIQQIFGWSLSILGISVFVMFFYSGFLWLTAAGNTSKIGEAKTHITNAVFGAILLLSSYLILYTINPDFVKNTVNLPGLKQTTSTP